MWFDVYLPQKDGQLFTELVAAGKSVDSARRTIFEEDLAAIRRADIVLVVLDGRTVDEGASFELGFAYAIGKVCVGLQTDSRRLLPLGNNPMVESALQRVFASADELSEWAAQYAIR
jgi:nucleoside 2-deoxyribosyltransferase